MELMLLRQFQQQILLQCQFVLLAAEQVNEGLRQPDVTFTFYALQSLLNSAANISKALWGDGGRCSVERQDLRDSIGITDASPLYKRAMRNNYEHFDERLDKWWKESKTRSVIDLNIGPRSFLSISIDSLDWFRNFEATTLNLTFWSEDFNIQELIAEVQRIFPRVEEEANKPH